MSAIEASLRLDIAQYQAQLAKAQGDAKKFRDQLRSTGGGRDGLLTGIVNDLSSMGPALGATALIGGIKGVMNSMDDLVDAGIRLNETPETLQRVAYAGQLMAGMDLDGIVGSFLKLEKALGDVENQKASEALANLGVTTGSLAAMPLDQKILALSGAFQEARASGTGYNDILALMGKSAGELIPLLAASSEQIEEMFGQAVVVPDSAVQQLADLNDKVDGFFLNMKAGLAGLVALSGSGLEAIFGGKGLAAFETPDDLTASQALLQQKREEQAAAQETARLDAEQAKVQKEIDKEREKAAKQAATEKQAAIALQETLNRQALEALPPAERAAAAAEEIKKVYADMANTGGLFFEQTKAGLQALAQARMDKGNFAGAQQALEQLQKIRELERIQQGAGKEQQAETDKTTKEQDAAAKEQGRVTLARQVLDLEIQIANATAAAGGEEDAKVQALQDQLAVLQLTASLQEQLQLSGGAALELAKEKVAADRASAAAAEARAKAESQGKATANLQEEMALLRAKAGGDEKAVAELEKQQGIRRDARQIAEQTGMSPQQALRLAATRADLNEQIAENDGFGGDGGGRRAGRIRGYRQAQGAVRGFSGLDAFYADQQFAPSMAGTAADNAAKQDAKPAQDVGGKLDSVAAILREGLLSQ